ncbi:hypothetical protein AAEU76_005204 [Salmonella enterica subsp. enterica serovar Wedding]
MSSPLFLDMLTSGQGKYAQVIEIALVDIAGEIVFENRLKPTVSVEETATAVHGIRSQQLLPPGWPQTAEELRQLMGSRTIVIFGAELDIHLLRQTAAPHKDAALWLDASDIHCAMRLAARTLAAVTRGNVYAIWHPFYAHTFNFVAIERLTT